MLRAFFLLPRRTRRIKGFPSQISPQVIDCISMTRKPAIRPRSTAAAAFGMDSVSEGAVRRNTTFAFANRLRASFRFNAFTHFPFPSISVGSSVGFRVDDTPTNCIAVDELTHVSDGFLFGKMEGQDGVPKMVIEFIVERNTDELAASDQVQAAKELLDVLAVSCVGQVKEPQLDQVDFLFSRLHD